MITDIKKIKLPTRFESLNLNNKDDKKLKSFILRNNMAIDYINNIIEVMYTRNSGMFSIIRGQSGVGKTTFLRTINLYIKNIEVHVIYDDVELQKYFSKITDNNNIKIIILENRESIAEMKYLSMEKDVRSINRFIRSENGRNSIIVWPCNDQSIVEDIKEVSKRIGGSFLIGDDTIYNFKGPSTESYFQILKNTFSIFNYENDIEDYGVDEEISNSIINNQGKSITIGTYLEKARGIIINNIKKMNGYHDLSTENFKLWIIVISDKSCIRDINYLTKGNNRQIDLDRLLNSTGSNIKTKFLQNKSILRMFSGAVDCRILSINKSDICRLIKSTKDKKLKGILEEIGVTTNDKLTRTSFINNCEIIQAIEEIAITSDKDIKVDDDLEFTKILKIAESNDKILNKEICEILKEEHHIYSYVIENNMGEFTTIRSDAHCGIKGNYLELEFMWRTGISKATIAEYTLKKIYNYAEALRII